MAIVNLAARKDKPLEGFGIFGLVKETGKDDEGLAEFHSKYFNSNPLYKDADRVFYEALGRRKIGIPRNPFALYSGYKAIARRHREKKIKQNLKGEGLLQGGIIVFGKDGLPKYAYREETGKEVPIDDLVAAVNAVKREE